jgi:hypothetical protein
MAVPFFMPTFDEQSEERTTLPIQNLAKKTRRPSSETDLPQPAKTRRIENT